MLKQHQQDLNENKSITKLANIFKTTQLEDNEQHPSTETETPSQQQVQTEESHSKHPYTHYERLNKRKKWQQQKRAGRFYEEIQKEYIDQKGS